MKVWMLWHGGPGYAHGSIEEDTEEFDSLADAKRSFDSRADSWNTYYPMVERAPQDEDGQSAWIFFYDPREVEDAYPDRILEYGPKGGLRVSHG